MRVDNREDLRPSTIIGILVGLLAIGTATWIVVRTASDYQESTHPNRPAATDSVDQLASEPSQPGSGRLEADDIDPAFFDDRPGDGASPTTQPPSGAPEPTTPPAPPKPPKKTPDTTPPPPPNEPPAIDGFTVHSEGGSLTVGANVTDSEAALASIRVVLSEKNQVVGMRAVEAKPDASSQKVNADFTIDTTKKARRLIEVTIEVVDRAGAEAHEATEHDVVRRTKVWVSPVSMTLDANSACFDHTPALALTGELTVAGSGIDSTSKLGGEFRADKTSMILMDEQLGFVDGDKAWFMLVTTTPDLVNVNNQIISLGKIQALHSQVGSFARTFDKKGCSGAITYTITAELL